MIMKMIFYMKKKLIKIEMKRYEEYPPVDVDLDPLTCGGMNKRSLLF